MNEETALRPVENCESRARVSLTRRTAAKVTAFLLFVVMVIIAAAGVVGIVVGLSYDVYTVPEEEHRTGLYDGLAWQDTKELVYALMVGNETSAQQLCSYRNFVSVTVRQEGENGLNWSYETGRAASDYTLTKSCWFNTVSHDVCPSYVTLSEQSQGNWTKVTVTITLTENLLTDDHYRAADTLVSVGYALRYWVYFFVAAAVILAIACFVFLMCAAGRHPDSEEARPGWGTSLPFDLLTALTAFAVVALIGVSIDFFYWSELLVLAVLFVTLPPILLGWCMSFALRVKLGGWWKNTLVCRILRLLKWALRRLPALLKGLVRVILAPFRWIGRGIRAVVNAVALVPLAVALFAGALLFELIAQLLCWYSAEALLMVWIFSRLVLLLLFGAVVLMMQGLQQAGKALAAGDLDHQINTGYLFGPFKTHGENLNRIGEGISAAVEQRMKSEHTKTELITNVSHDLKTPLTSLINYADLIEKEPCDNPNITEYAAVLHRQSERMKRLIDDLVELSKSATGNMELDMAPCEAGVFLDQTLGEYEQRMKDCRLEPVVRRPDHPLTIQADGRKLWRVMDNLMGNICKYALSGTRVYLSLEEQDGSALFTFKNTSREALDLSADELMERFVRGDASRTAEGSGLGLSIAQSLTELQGGTLTLTTDGDLFKVTLKFPLVR